MITKIQLRKDAKILASNGKQVGSLERVVVNPGSHALTNIVVKTGSLVSHDEKVVPIEMVAETTKDLVVLRDDIGDLEALPPFEERRLVDEKGVLDQPPQSTTPPVIYGFPTGAPAIVPDPGEQFVTQLEQNIPDGTVAMKEGAHVITEDGKQVGSVESVLADPSADQITHLLVSSGLLTKTMKLIPIKWVVTFGEETVNLRVDKDEVEKLPEATVVE